MKKILLTIGVLASLLLALPASASLWNYYKGDLPSIETRSQTAALCGIKDYKGTADQNIKLESCLSGEQKLGAGYVPVTAYESRTTAYLTAAATTINVATTKDKSGVQIDLANISSAGTVKVYMNLEPGGTNEEAVVCTGVTAASWTNCTRGLAFQGGSETSSSTLTKSHNAGSKIIITNIGQFYNQYVSVDGTQTINDVKTFSSLPLLPTATPTLATQAVSKAYADALTVPSSYWTLSGSDIYRNGGNVAIGKMSPAYRLDVNTTDGTNTKNAQFVKTNSISSGSNKDNVYVYTSNGTAATQIDNLATYGDNSSSITEYNNNRASYTNYAGTTTVYYGYRADNPTLSGGNITTNTAFYVPAQTAGTNNYGLYSMAPNVFTATTTMATTTVTGNLIGDAVLNTFTAGETINASASAIPVYLHTDGLVYKTSATYATSTFTFIGFAVNGQNKSASQTILVQTTGVVQGLSGMATGSYYFLADTAGTFSTTAGTVTYQIGKALTPTKLLIEKGKKIITQSIAWSTATSPFQATTTISTGFHPNRISFIGYATVNDNTIYSAVPSIWVNGTTKGWAVTHPSSFDVFAVSGTYLLSFTATQYSRIYIYAHDDVSVTVVEESSRASGSSGMTGYITIE